MPEQEKQAASTQDTMEGNLKEKPQHAASFDAQKYAENEGSPSSGPDGSAGGANVSAQGGGSGSTKQAGNTGHTPDASG